MDLSGCRPRRGAGAELLWLCSRGLDVYVTQLALPWEPGLPGIDVVTRSSRRVDIPRSGNETADFKDLLKAVKGEPPPRIELYWSF